MDEIERGEKGMSIQTTKLLALSAKKIAELFKVEKYVVDFQERQLNKARF